MEYFWTVMATLVYLWTVTATLVYFWTASFTCQTTCICVCTFERWRPHCVLVNGDFHPSNSVHLRMHFLKGEIHIWIVCLLVWLENGTFPLFGPGGDHAIAKSTHGPLAAMWTYQRLKLSMPNPLWLHGVSWRVGTSNATHTRWIVKRGLYSVFAITTSLHP